MLAKFYKKIYSTVLLGRKMTTNKKGLCPPDKAGKPKEGKIILEKPIMRNLHLKQTMRNLYIALALAGISTAAFYYFHNLPRIKAYEDFYSTYDADAAFEVMRENGYIDSCPPEPKKKK